MTVLDLLVLAEVLMRLMSRIIEIFLMIRDALQTRKGKERSQYTQTAEAIREPWGVSAPCGSPLLYKNGRAPQGESMYNNRGRARP